MDTGIIQRVFYDSTVGLFNLGREIELDKTNDRAICWSCDEE